MLQAVRGVGGSSWEESSSSGVNQAGMGWNWPPGWEGDGQVVVGKGILPKGPWQGKGGQKQEFRECTAAHIHGNIPLEQSSSLSQLQAGGGPVLQEIWDSAPFLTWMNRGTLRVPLLTPPASQHENSQIGSGCEPFEPFSHPKMPSNATELDMQTIIP